MGFLKSAVEMNKITECAIERNAQEQLDEFVSKAADIIENAAEEGEYNVTINMSVSSGIIARIIEKLRYYDYTVKVENHTDWHRVTIDWS